MTDGPRPNGGPGQAAGGSSSRSALGHGDGARDSCANEHAASCAWVDARDAPATLPDANPLEICPSSGRGDAIAGTQPGNDPALRLLSCRWFGRPGLSAP